MRILFAIAEMGVGGAETIVEDLAVARLNAGDEVAVVSAGGFRADRVADEGARLVHAPMQGRERSDLFRAVRAVRGELRQHRPDLLHAHNVKAAALARAAGVLRRVPTLVTLHGVPDAEYRSAARILRGSATRLVAVSPDVADRVVSAGFPDERVHVVENAVQTPAPHDRGEARARLGLPAEVPVAVCIARLVDQKRHDLLLEAWREQEPEAVLLIAGDGPNRALIEGQAADLGLGRRVRVLGARTDVDWLLAAADVSVLATDWEGLPISVLEAMAAGVPVVASAVGGLAETLPAAAWLVAPGSAGALAEGLAGLLTDAGVRATFRAAGAALVAERFGVERMRAAYLAEYEALLA